MSALVLLALAATSTGSSLVPEASRTLCVSCEPSRGLDQAPVAIAFLDGGLGAARSAIPKSEVGLVLGGSILAAFDDFYGHLRGRAIASASWAIDDWLEVSAQVELMRIETVISSLEAGRLGFGTTSLGALWRVAGAPDWDFSISTRVALPTDYRARADALPFGVDIGVLSSWRAAETLELHGHVLVLGSAQISQGPTFHRVGLSLGGGASWQALSWLALTADVGALLGYDDPLDRLYLAGGARFRVSPSWCIELSAASPLFGEDRTMVVGGLGARLSLP